VYFYGKPVSLGIKSANHGTNMQINELFVSKNSQITQIAMGHDGLFALLKVSLFCY
jgi:RCR-type E3 ubiquitin transferase